MDKVNTGKVTSIKVTKVVINMNLYPRTVLDEYNVNEIAEAMRSGKEMPPIEISKKGNILVDGYHRLTAHIKVHGNKSSINCIKKDFASEAEMLLRSMVLNSGHGRKLTTQDRVRCITLGQELGLSVDMLSDALGLTQAKIGKLVDNRIASSGSKSIPLKATTEHLAKTELSEEQLEYNRKAGGLHQSFYVNQVIAMLESDSVDWSNEALVKRLAELSKLLDKYAKSTA